MGLEGGEDNDLQGYTESQLIGELERRKLVKAAADRTRRVATWQHVIANKDALLKFLKHTRTSCSDANRANAGMNSHGYPSCTRCYLMDELQYNPTPLMFQNIEFEVEVKIHDTNAKPRREDD